MLTAGEIAKALGIEKTFDQVIEKVVTDSRLAGKNTLFVALIGENTDGHKFISSALKNGCPFAVASFVPQGVDASKLLLVDDTKSALLKIAGCYRRKFNIPLVGVTGSVGKTTTREFISCVMRKKFSLLKNEENLNNEIGVSHTLLSMNNNHTAAVMEMGMDGLGQIEKISTACYPQIAVITNIGVSHLEKLKTRENILRAKTEILIPMDKGAPLVLCKDNDLLSQYSNDDFKIYSYGIASKDADVKAVNIKNFDDRTEFEIVSPFGNCKCMIPINGEHNVLNALAAFTVGSLLKIDKEDIIAALKEYKTVGMRQNVIERDNIKYVADCYNASPDSLLAAAKTLSQSKSSGRKILVVSDMLELGDNEKQLHRECGEKIKELPIDALLGIGKLTQELIKGAQGMKETKFFETKEELSRFLAGYRRKNDTFWFKASRGMKLEEVFEKLI